MPKFNSYKDKPNYKQTYMSVISGYFTMQHQAELEITSTTTTTTSTHVSGCGY